MLDTISKTFGTENLYEVLGIEAADAEDDAKLRKAYLKLALKCHPDKVEPSVKEESTIKFQILGRIYEFLKDSDRRKNYNETGTWGEEAIELNIFTGPRIDEHTIAEFKKYYQGSEEEREDVKKFYNKFQGDIFKIIENVFLAELLEDEARIQGIINQLVEDGEVEEFEVKSDAARRKKKLRKAKSEAMEAEEALKEIRKKHNLAPTASLEQAIMARNAQRNVQGAQWLEDMERRYSAAGAKEPTSKRSRKK